MRQPPLDTADASRRGQWRRSVTEQLQARSEKSDPDAVFALGLACARDGKGTLPAMLPPNDVLNAALDDDPAQASAGSACTCTCMPTRARPTRRRNGW